MNAVSFRIHALCVAFTLITAPAALSEPASVEQVQTALERAGASSSAAVILSGDPTIQARLGAHGLRAVMQQCDDAQEACYRVRMTACNEIRGRGFDAALSSANRYNTGEYPGTAYAVSGNAAPGVCVRYDADLTGDAVFGARHTAAFQRALDELSDTVAQSVAAGGNGASR
jgi:hypothetical protein